MWCGVITVLAADKALHFFSGGMLAGMLMPFGFEWAWAGVVVAGIGKEVYDLVSRKGMPEIADAFATIVGGSVVVISHVILM